MFFEETADETLGETHSMEVYASYYGSVILDPSRDKELGPPLRFLKETARSLEESDALPVEVQTGIRFHHNPADAKHHQDVAAILYAANRLVHSIGIGVSAADFLQPNADAILEKLGITQERIDGYLIKIIEAMEDARSFLTI